ncbi:DUF2098 domain-containing protein [Methanolapillus millepedarum]|uniref:DUF2098 domain-containing protein n=1 Tax=Methanolapillus millepedarum TaxID=3028296 RepID=A0AA96ZWC4_9EURY|nr:hypothetical protein MsAc7_13540 [Methanosarcinaceae archaeon Ac7]
MANQDKENKESKEKSGGGSELQVFDVRGVPMKVGDFVKYINTGTVGHILEIMEDDEGVWAYLDSTELYYKIGFLEITLEIKTAADKRKDLEDEIQEKIRLREEVAGSASTENVEMGGAG